MPTINCDGLGGQAMAQAGCHVLENTVEKSAMLTHALGVAGYFYKLLRQVKRYLRQNQPDLVVVVDSPAWNFHVAKEAKKLQIPVLYYVAPQMWAWGGWRIKKLRRRADQVACILPFEEEWFKKRGINAHFVGHPLFDDPANDIETIPDTFKSENFPTVALLPGSRDHEIEKLWVPMQKIARRIKEEYPKTRFVTAAAKDSYISKLQNLTDPDLRIGIYRESINSIVKNADLTLVSSGTATLEVAAANCPMIIMYYVNPIHWNLAGRWLVKTKHLSLVNILSDKELVPEFIPFYGNINKPTETALSIIKDDEKRRIMRRELREFIELIDQPGASAKVVEIIKEMLQIS